jgi:hypothetical protein
MGSTLRVRQSRNAIAKGLQSSSRDRFVMVSALLILTGACAMLEAAPFGNSLNQVFPPEVARFSLFVAKIGQHLVYPIG